MATAFIPLSTPYLGPKSAITAPSPPRTCIRLRPSPRVSASSTTAEKTTTRSRSYSHIATAASLYEVLGIQMGATCQEIKTAYRRLARVLHPDVSSNGQNDRSADEFIRIHAAYATLSDPEKRADYNRTLLRRRLVSSPFVTSPSAAGFSGCHTRRRWETDQCW